MSLAAWYLVGLLVGTVLMLTAPIVGGCLERTTVTVIVAAVGFSLCAFFAGALVGLIWQECAP